MTSANQSAETLIQLLQKKKRTLSVAENATGGALAQALRSRSSQAFQLGIVMGSGLGRPALGISNRVYRKYGIASQEMAAAMAHEVCTRCGTSLGLAVTGTGQPKEDGTGAAWVAISNGKKIAVRFVSLALPEARSSEEIQEAIREQSVQAALSFCLDAVEEKKETLALFLPLRRYRRCLRGNPLASAFRYFLPWYGDKPADIFFKLLLLAALGTGIWAVYEMASTTITNHQSARVLEQAVSAWETEPTPEAQSNLPDGYLSQFAALYQMNPDIAGWITIPDTNINLPVMQREDNTFYLSHDINQEYDMNGLPFMDFRNKLEPDIFSTNTLIYGHNMTSGRIFRDLVYYKDPAYYQEHPIITFDTVYNQGQWVIFSCFEANTEATIGEVFPYFNFVNTEDPQQIQWYIDEVTARSYFTVDLDVNVEDTFLTLQTCTNDQYETKICVVARRLREGESADSFPFDSAVENANRVKPIRY